MASGMQPDNEVEEILPLDIGESDIGHQGQQ